MGGCCCCSSKGAGVSRSPTFFDYTRGSEEREPLSSNHGTVAALSTALLVNTNLDTSSPDTYRPPPAPLPYDASLGRPQTLPSNQETCDNKDDAEVHSANTGTVDETIFDNNTLETVDEPLKKSDCKVEKDTELASSMEIEVELEKSGELKKSSEPLTLVVEECPTCLEEYDDDNPKIITKCEHHFHLACIFEWMERSDTCPVCHQLMIFTTPGDV